MTKFIKSIKLINKYNLNGKTISVIIECDEYQYAVYVQADEEEPKFIEGFEKLRQAKCQAQNVGRVLEATGAKYIFK